MTISPTLREHVVIDTSTYVSALMFKASVPAQAISKAWAEFDVAYSAEVLAELAAVLRRRKFRRFFMKEECIRLLEYIDRAANLFEITEHVVVCRDPKDDKFLSLAQKADAAYLITGDQDLLTLGWFHNTRILSPAAFLALP